MPGQVQDLNQQTVCNDLRLVCGININSVNNKDHIINPVNCGKTKKQKTNAINTNMQEKSLVNL